MKSNSLKTLVGGLVLGLLVGASSLAGAADEPFPPVDGTGTDRVSGTDYTWEYTRDGALEAAERALKEWKKNNPGCVVVSRSESYDPVTLHNGASSYKCTISFGFVY